MAEIPKYEVVGEFMVNNQRKRLYIDHNADGTFTAGGPNAQRDFASRGAGLRWLKRIFRDPGVPVRWFDVNPPVAKPRERRRNARN